MLVVVGIANWFNERLFVRSVPVCVCGIDGSGSHTILLCLKSPITRTCVVPVTSTQCLRAVCNCVSLCLAVSCVPLLYIHPIIFDVPLTVTVIHTASANWSIMGWLY